MKNKYFLLFLLIVFFFGATFFFGWSRGRDVSEEQVSSQIILEKIKEQYFLVTRSMFLDTEAQIEVDKTEGWKSFFVSDSINSRAIVRVDIGVDLKEMSETSIEIDDDKKNILIYIPKASILDSSIFGDMEIETKKGLWTNIKSVFSDDEGREYNIAAKELINQAEQASRKQEEVFLEAHQDTLKIISLIVSSISEDYSLELKVLN